MDYLPEQTANYQTRQPIPAIVLLFSSGQATVKVEKEKPGKG